MALLAGILVKYIGNEDLNNNSSNDNIIIMMMMMMMMLIMVMNSPGGISKSQEKITDSHFWIFLGI